jgi:hypothetical protein
MFSRTEFLKLRYGPHGVTSSPQNCLELGVPSHLRRTQELQMPYLHGQPYKWELRKEISELRKEAWELRRENLRLRIGLRYNREKRTELEAKLERLKTAVGSAIAEVDNDVTAVVVDNDNRKAG